MSKNKNNQPQKTIDNKSIKLEQTYSGPIPPPSFLKAYEEVIPGSAKEILSMAVRNSNHAIEMDKEQVSLVNRHADKQARGQHYALICFILITLLTAYSIYKGKDIIAIAAVVLETTGLAIAFIYGKYVNSKSK